MIFEFMRNSFFSFSYEFGFLPIFSLILAFLALVTSYIRSIFKDGPTAIHKTTITKYIIIYTSLLVCFFILVYCSFIRKICLSNSPGDCMTINTLFLIIFSLIIVFIIQIIQDLFKTYKDRTSYREEAKIAEDLDEVIEAVNNYSRRR